MTQTWLRTAAVGMLVLGLAGAVPGAAHADGPDRERARGTAGVTAEVRQKGDHKDAGSDKGAREARPDKSEKAAQADVAVEASVQGKSPSDPDGMTNAYGGTSGKDKPGYDGGRDKTDQDGNNGCGNDADREDDNRGNCGGKARAGNKAHDDDHGEKAKGKTDDDDGGKARAKARDDDGKDNTGRERAAGCSGDDKDDGACPSTEGDHRAGKGTVNGPSDDRDHNKPEQAASCVLVCHITGAGAAVLVSVDKHAVQAHLDHGDKLAVNGECVPASDATPSGKVEAGGSVEAAGGQTGTNASVSAGADVETTVAGWRQVSDEAPTSTDQPAPAMATTETAAAPAAGNVNPSLQQTGPQAENAAADGSATQPSAQPAVQAGALPQLLPTAGDPLTYALAALGILAGIVMISAGLTTLQRQGVLFPSDRR